MSALGSIVINLEAIRRWFGGKGKPLRDWNALQHWAEDRQYVMRHARGQEGFVIDGRQGRLPWRMEWGPSKRSYIHGGELRLRAEVEVAPELNAVVMSRKLQERLETEVFDQFVGDLQTRVDTQTPAEVRWLVMHVPLSGPEMRGLKSRWSAVANIKSWLERWLSGPLRDELEQLQVHPELPVVVVVTRQRCTLRVAMPHPTLCEIEGWLKLFECCLREARRAGTTGSAAEDMEITQPGLFVPTPQPEREHASLT